MAPSNSGSPAPPSDFFSRALPVETISAGTRLTRIHLAEFAPIHFGSKGINRFDDPRKIFGVCYLAMTQEGAFAETCLLGVGDRFVHRSYFRARCFSEIEVIAPLRILSLHGPGLARIGATSAVASGSHVASGEWSRATYEHPDLPDGIAYRSKHDDGEHCIALYDRASDSIAPVGSPRPMMNHLRFEEFCARYGIGIA